jgi:hypothetical protein
MTVKVNTRRDVEIPEIGVLIPNEPFPPDPYECEVAWSERPEGGYYIAWTIHDDAYSEYDWSEGVEFREFRTEWDRDEFIEGAVAEHGYGRVFVVECYEHTLVHYSPIGTVNYPDHQWDVRPSGVIIVPDDVTDPLEFAKATLDEYSSWRNGDVWGVISREVDADGNLVPDASDECWGYIGSEYAESEARAWVNPTPRPTPTPA